MPTPNAIFGTLQSSVLFPGTSGTSTLGAEHQHSLSVKRTSSANNLQEHQHLHEQPLQTFSPKHVLSHASTHASTHAHDHIRIFNHNHCHSSTQISQQPSPDPAVMEFISKIGQIIIKARTVSPTISFDQTSSSGTGSAANLSNSNSSQSNHALSQQQQNLEIVLQDMDLWRNSTPVHVNILHTAQHVLLERWVISYTPATASSTSPVTPASDSSRATKSPYTAHLPPKTKRSQTQAIRSSSAPGTASASSSASPKDTTDLVLLLQSLYTQIRSLPLQSCLTSSDDQTKLVKTDLTYSATSAHEDITQARSDRMSHNFTHYDATDAPITDPSEDPYAGFSSSLKATLPLEFVQAASLKVINFEASHVQWGCVRVTGMYDESVGGRIAPENFQDSTKVQKRRRHRSKIPTNSSDSSTKSAKRHSKDSGLWTAASQPLKRDISLEHPAHLAAPSTSLKLSAVVEGHSIGIESDPVPIQSSISSTSRQQDHPSVSTSEEFFESRLQSFKRNGGSFLSSFSPSIPPAAAVAVGKIRDQSYKSVLQESPIPKHDDIAQSITQGHEHMQAYRFPPPPSPPLSIPLARKASTDQTSYSPISEMDRTPTNTTYAPPQYSTSHHPSPPFVQQPYQHSHSPFSTSPLARVITRRRSSRLSIVMTCNDNSPDLTRPQSPPAVADEHDADLAMEDGQPASQFRRRSSLQDAKSYFELEGQMRPLDQSPSRPSFLRRSSLNPSNSLSHCDLFGSLVGSYEESILSGRMSTLPSKPLVFTAQIGVLANQDYKDCPPKLRCPKHVQLEFPAVFYDYESSSSHHGHHLSHSHQSHHLHHSQSSQALPSKGVHSYGHHAPISPSHHLLNSFASSPSLPSYFSSNMATSYGSGSGSLPHSLAHSIPAAQDDPILPYVGNLDLDSGFRGSRRFARMPGGMRIPLRGQVQVMIKNPNKTVVKVFLVPYDFTDMPPGTKTFLRQKYYSTSAGMGAMSSTALSNNGSGTLRYAIHLQFCCPAPGYVYLYRSIRVVFANRVPDGKESLRVVLEGLGMTSRTIGNNGVNQVLSTPPPVSRYASDTTPTGTVRKMEERYAKMRKGEVLFCNSKRKKDMESDMAMSMDDNLLLPIPPHGLGLTMDGCSKLANPHAPYNPSTTCRHAYHSSQQLDFDGQPYNSTIAGAKQCRGIDRTLEIADLGLDHDMSHSQEMNESISTYLMNPNNNKRAAGIGPLDAEMDGAVNGRQDNDAVERDYRLIPSSVLVSYSPSAKSATLSPKAGGASPYLTRESALPFSRSSAGRQENN
ncbi:hypothetical protein EDD11_001348 [Mortierella claussenii]|nr:hypothetical protein EDD11_001348 [Mortierella claussenii]